MRGFPNTEIILVGPYSSSYGGIHKYLKQLVNHLTVQGYRFKVLDTDKGRYPQGSYNGLKIAQGIVKYFFLALKLVKTKGGLVHILSSSCDNFLANGFLIAIGKFSRKKIIISMLGGGFPAIIQQAGRIRRFISKQIFKAADEIIACNKDIKKTISELGIRVSKVTYISNALPFTLSLNGICNKDIHDFIKYHKPFVSSVSALQPEYDIPTLLKAIVRLKKKFPTIGLLIVVLDKADKAVSGNVQYILQKNRIKENVAIYKNVDSILPIIKRSDCYVRSTLVDGDSVSVREALLLKVPVVASDTAFRPNGVLLFKKGNDADLSEKIEKILRNPKLSIQNSPMKEANENIRKIETLYYKLSNSF